MDQAFREGSDSALRSLTARLTNLFANASEQQTPLVKSEAPPRSPASDLLLNLFLIALTLLIGLVVLQLLKHYFAPVFWIAVAVVGLFIAIYCFRLVSKRASSNDFVPDSEFDDEQSYY